MTKELVDLVSLEDISVASLGGDVVIYGKLRTTAACWDAGNGGHTMMQTTQDACGPSETSMERHLLPSAGCDSPSVDSMRADVRLIRGDK